MSGALTFLLASVLLVVFSKSRRPLNLPYTEAIAFALLVLVSSLSVLVLQNFAHSSSSIPRVAAIAVFLYPYYLKEVEEENRLVVRTMSE
jgi:uncharacterized protein YhhL (DUF1145 family)